MSRLPQTQTSLLRYLRQQKRTITRLANSTPYALSGMSVTAPGLTTIAGTAGAARIEQDADGMRQYAADGTTVLLDTADAATIRSRGNNTALGANAQQALTTGTGNTAVGADAQLHLTTGANDTAVGAGAQMFLDVGIGNTAVGPQAQLHLISGHYNTAVGHWAQNAYGVETVSASYQTSIGPHAGQSSATQVDGITTIGDHATAGAANATSIGREARADHAGSIALGYQALTTQTNQVMVGPRDVEITDTTKGLVLVSPDGTRTRITAANGGSLLVNGTVIGGGSGGPLFADPNADRLAFWDDSAGAFAPLTASTGLVLAGTDLTVRPAADTLMGGVELATPAETVAGTDTVRAVTPAGVKAAIGAGHIPAVVVRVTSSSAAISTVETALATLPSITADGSTQVRVMFTYNYTYLTVATDGFTLRIYDGASQISEHYLAPGQTFTLGQTLMALNTPTAGAHVYKVTLVRKSGTGTCTLTATATAPAVLVLDTVG